MTSTNNPLHDPSATYYLDFLGCRLNAAEIEELARRITGAGGMIVTNAATASVIIVNTCAVTTQAVKRSQRRIIRLHQMQPRASIAVLGCWATEDAESAWKLPGVRWVLPNKDKSHAIQLITGCTSSPAFWQPGKWGHTRAFLAVQDGCDHHCTYCITRILRGPTRSRSLKDTLSEVTNLVASGAKEVVLTGVSLGAYGHDRNQIDGLADLIHQIFSKTDLPRLRLSSIEPWDVTDHLISLWQNPRLCRQIHLPLQSGADTILRRMGRPYSADQYHQIVNRIRQTSPEIAVTTDVITGFPGERESEFNETVSMVEKVGFSKIHVFPYSERPGTAAVNLTDIVPMAIRKIRAKKLRNLDKKLSQSYRESCLGQILAVLYQKPVKGDTWMGLTDTYIKVLSQTPRDVYNCIMDTEITSNRDGYVTGLIK